MEREIEIKFQELEDSSIYALENCYNTLCEEVPNAQMDERVIIMEAENPNINSLAKRYEKMERTHGRKTGELFDNFRNRIRDLFNTDLPPILREFKHWAEASRYARMYVAANEIYFREHEQDDVEERRRVLDNRKVRRRRIEQISREEEPGIQHAQMNQVENPNVIAQEVRDATQIQIENLFRQTFTGKRGTPCNDDIIAMDTWRKFPSTPLYAQWKTAEREFLNDFVDDFLSLPPEGAPEDLETDQWLRLVLKMDLFILHLRGHRTIRSQAGTTNETFHHYDARDILGIHADMKKTLRLYLNINGISM
jgi:hypothetical protein